MTASRSLDGIQFDTFRARLTGTVELEEAEAQAAALDETLVMIVVARVKDVQAKMDGREDPALARVAVCKATDARVVVDVDLRNTLVERLGLLGDDACYVPIVPKSERSGSVGDSEPVADEETGEIITDRDEDVADESAPAQNASAGTVPWAHAEVPEDGEGVRVYGRVPVSGDKALAGFLGEM